jgi:DNA-binding MarR family transcriptional regulator
MTTLKEELKTNAEFASIQHEVFLSLLVTVDRLSRRHSEFMAEYGVSQKQYNILRILRGAGSQGIPVMEIGRRMIEKSPDVSRIIDRLIDLGFVKRRRQRNDRRVVIVTITDKGLHLLSKMDIPVREEVVNALRHVPESDLKQLSSLLEQVRDSIYKNV